jgi:hypothetical protein
MKNQIKLLFIVINCHLGFAQIGNIAQPEMQILYRGYDNKIIPNIPCGQTLDLAIEGGTAQKASWTDSQGQNQVGYNLRVNGTARNVVVKINGLNEKGEIASTSTQTFHVKAFPAPQLLNESISKSSGMKANIGLGPDCPFTGVSFEVIGGTIAIGHNEYIFSGSVIPATTLPKVKIGQQVVVNVNYRRTNSSDTAIRTCSSVVVVNP